MAKVNLKRYKKDVVNIGDLIITEEFGARLVIANYEKYFTLNVETMEINSTFNSLEEIAELYLKGDYVIISNNNLEIKEL